MDYSFSEVEKKWQDKWEEAGVFHASDCSDKKSFTDLFNLRTPADPEFT